MSGGLQANQPESHERKSHARFRGIQLPAYSFYSPSCILAVKIMISVLFLQETTLQCIGREKGVGVASLATACF